NPALISTNGTNRFVTDSDIVDWNAAFSWGDHATAGYLTTSDWAAPGNIGVTSPASGTFTILQVDTQIDLKDHGSGNAVTIQAPPLGTPYTLTLPVGEGVNGQLLRTDGNGNLSWVSPGGGGDMMSGVYDLNTNGKVDQ